MVAQLDQMLQRVIGADVEIEMRAGAGLGRVRADPNQMEQLLLNLALNARDAMPGGGRLTIETRDVEIAGGTAPPAPPGRYVMLVVSDEGVGMDSETQQSIFEPFFTTKPEGAGLGLATVRSAVDRAGGLIRVDSAPGRGTTFQVYLPCADERSEPARRDESPARLAGGDETVLLVEDSEPVREVTRDLLSTLGYNVLAASNGREALAVLRAHAGPVHLLLADVVLPGLRGRTLAGRVAAERPGTRVLFMSGYGEGLAKDRGEFGEAGRRSSESRSATTASPAPSARCSTGPELLAASRAGAGAGSREDRVDCRARRPSRCLPPKPTATPSSASTASTSSSAPRSPRTGSSPARTSPACSPASTWPRPSS